MMEANMLTPSASVEEMVAYAKAWSEDEFAIRQFHTENRKRLLCIRDWMLAHTEVNPADIPLPAGEMYWYRCRTKPTAKKVMKVALQAGMDMNETAEFVKGMIGSTTPALGLRKNKKNSGKISGVNKTNNASVHNDKAFN